MAESVLNILKHVNMGQATKINGMQEKRRRARQMGREGDNQSFLMNVAVSRSKCTKLCSISSAAGVVAVGSGGLIVCAVCLTTTRRHYSVLS